MATEKLAKIGGPAGGGAPVGAPGGPSTTSGLDRVRGVTSGVKELNILIALILLMAFFAWRSPYFWNADNLLGVARAFSMTAIAAIGMTMVIITGGIDLSVGSVLALAGISSGLLLNRGWALGPAILGGLLIGVIFGMCNGLLVTRVGLPPFIATLGTLSIGRGLVYTLTKGYPVSIPSGETLLLQLGQGYIGPVPVPVIAMVIVAVIASFFLSSTTFGRYIYAVGGNEEAARLAGINVNRVKMVVYTISGLLAAFAGMILLSRLVSAQPSAGIGFELPVIAAAIIGGTSLSGGEGTVLGAVLGAAIIGVLENGMVLLGVDSYAYQTVTGAVILLAVTLDIIQKKRRTTA